MIQNTANHCYESTAPHQTKQLDNELSNLNDYSYSPGSKPVAFSPVPPTKRNGTSGDFLLMAIAVIWISPKVFLFISISYS